MTFGTLHAPLVSVIVINYNYGRFLAECLKSIADQTYPFIDCIVFDNGSTDDSKAVIQRIVQDKVFDGDGRSLTVAGSDTNLFQTPAAFEAFKYAKGSFVIFFDADDFMLPTCIEAHIRAMLYLRTPVGATCVDYYMSRGDQIVTSTGSFSFSKIASAKDEDSRPSARIVDLPKTSRTGSDLDLRLSELRFVGRTTRSWAWSGTCGLCFRQEMVELLFRRAPDLREHLDAYLIGGINCLTGSVLIDRPLVVYRHHGSNVFAAHPLIENFRFYKLNDNRGEVSAAVPEIIKTFLYMAGELAQRLDWSGTYIEAIETLYFIRSLPTPAQTRAYMRQLLKDNEATLTKAFGAQTYAQWAVRYANGKSIFPWLRRNAGRSQ